jgi:hypothetical protein
MGLLLLTYRMAEEYRTHGIKVNFVMTPATKVSKETLRKFTGYYRILGALVQNLNPHSLTPEQMARCYYHTSASEEFRNVTGMMVDAKNRIILPAEKELLDPVSLLRELRNTKHAPYYACNPENIERMWQLSHEVIATG